MSVKNGEHKPGDRIRPPTRLASSPEMVEAIRQKLAPALERLRNQSMGLVPQPRRTRERRKP